MCCIKSEEPENPLWFQFPLLQELLREAELLVKQKLHPITIVTGFREAAILGIKTVDFWL